MSDARRVTGPLLDVLELLIEAFRQDQDPHGWTIMKQTKRSGPTVYGVLERLEEWGWVTGTWEELPSGENRPRRRHYRLTPDGRARAQALVAERRPRREGFLAFRDTLPGDTLPGGAR
ncbi:PadR family transcriptional regulator [Actinosynnema sp. NPDC020468]|uniref:PadR family transcriptional regulator n=1 Tax=Actinosynnema sp. NPDC020468 TaxID=3154488 RepID=UPI0033D9E390